MYTEDGNWDLVGNNLKIFFIRDAMKFPDMIHAFKVDPVSNVANPQRMFDFVSRTPGGNAYDYIFIFSMGYSSNISPYAGIWCKHL